MKRFVTITLQYYRLLLIYNVGFSLFTAAIFYLFLWHLTNSLFLLSKVFAFLSAALIHFYSASASYFYFRNAGYRMSKIIAGGFALDICFATIIISITSIFRHVVNLNY